MSDSEPFDLYGWARSIPDAEIRAELEKVERELRQLGAKRDLLAAALSVAGKVARGRVGS